MKLNDGFNWTLVDDQVEATNKILINMIKKNDEQKPHKWHEALSNVLWAWRD